MSGPSLNLTAVGYAGNQLDDDSGSVFLTPQFVNVGLAKKITLKDLTPIATDDYELGRGDVFIQFLANDGSSIADKVFTWDGKKWIYQATKADASAFEIPAGLGMSVDNSVDPDDAYVRLQSAGEVSKDDAVIELDQDSGSVFSGNAFPVDIKLGRLTPELNEGSEYELGRGDIFIQFLSNDGSSISDKVFTWDGKKWIYQATKADASDFNIPAGQGFVVDNSVDPDDAIVSLRIPAPEL